MSSAGNPQGVEITRASCQAAEGGASVRRLLAEVVAECRAEESTVWLLSPDRLSMQGTFNHGPKRSVLEQISVPLDNSVVGMVASHGVAMSIGPGDPHNPTVDQKTGVDTRAMIAVPLYIDGRLVGVQSVINPIGRPLFAAEDIDQLSWRAYLLSLVLASLHGGR